MIPKTCSLYTAWYLLKQRPHHLADVLASEGGCVTVFAPRGLRHRSPAVDASVQVQAPLLLPSRFELFGPTNRLARAYNEWLRQRSVDDFANSAADVHIYAHCPTYLPLTKPTRLIYDCMDDWGAFHNAAPGINLKEERLCEMSDEIWVVSKALERKLQRHSAKIRYVPNGVNYRHFEGVRPAPYKKTIGYVGCIEEWLDFDLIRETASILKEWQMVFVGPVYASAGKLAKIAMPNVQLVGPKPYAEIPRILNDVDVCIIPFVRSKLIDATSPIKIYEYLAAGRPVVSTSMPEVVSMSRPGVVSCADTAKEFAARIVDAYEGVDADACRAVARFHSWNSRFVSALNNGAKP